MKLSNLTLSDVTIEEAATIFGALARQGELEAQITDLESQLSDFIKEIGSLRGENATLRAKIDELVRQTSEYESMLDTYTAPDSKASEAESATEEYVFVKDMAAKYNMTTTGMKFKLDKYKVPVVIINGKRAVTASDWNAFESGGITKVYNGDKDHDYIVWAKAVRHMIDDAGLDRSSVLSETYKRLNRVYGVVWCQLQKEYGKPADQLKLCYWMDTCKKGYEHLFENTLDSVINDMVA